MDSLNNPSLTPQSTLHISFVLPAPAPAPTSISPSPTPLTHHQEPHSGNHPNYHRTSTTRTLALLAPLLHELESISLAEATLIPTYKRLEEAERRLDLYNIIPPADPRERELAKMKVKLSEQKMGEVEMRIIGLLMRRGIIVREIECLRLMLTRDGKEGKEEEEEGLRVLGMDDQEEPACEETKDGTGEEYYDAMDEEEDEDEAAAARQAKAPPPYDSCENDSENNDVNDNHTHNELYYSLLPPRPQPQPQPCPGLGPAYLVEK